MAENEEEVRPTGPTIKIVWDRETGKATWDIHNMNHVEAMWLLQDIAKSSIGYAMGEIHGHSHEEGGHDH